MGIRKSIKPPAASNNSFAPTLNYINAKIQAKLDGSCLKQGKVAFTHKKMVNICIIYEIHLCSFNVAKDFALGNFLFGGFKITKITTDFDK